MIKELVETMSTVGEALAFPDHPLLLSGPTLLALAENVLTASFVYTSGSRPVSSVAEQARVLLARLAYPRHTVFEAIFEDGSLFERVDLGLFDSYRVGAPRALSRPDGDDASRNRTSSAVERLRGLHFARFAANQQGAFRERPEGARASFTLFSAGTTPRYKFVDSDPYNLTAYVPEGPRALTINRMQRVAETFTASDYGLGQGISAVIDVAGSVPDGVYLEQHALHSHLAFASEDIGVDASKPLRAGQFAGGMVKSAW